MAAVTVLSDSGAQENKVYLCFHFFSICLPWSDGSRCHNLSFLMLSFKPAFSLSSFTLIKRFFSSSLLSAIGVVSSAYRRPLIFLMAILIPACDSSSLAFHVMYSAYKLNNKQGDNIQPWWSPFPVLNQSIVPVHLLSGHMYVDHLYAALCLKTVRLYEAETIFQSNHISVTHVNINRTRSSWANLTSSGDIV